MRFSRDLIVLRDDFYPSDFRLSAFEDFAGFCCLNTIISDMPLLSDNLYYVK